MRMTPTRNEQTLMLEASDLRARLEAAHGETKSWIDIAAKIEEQLISARREAMAARDGLTIWKRRAEEAEAKVGREADLQAIVRDTSDVLAALVPDACGTLSERVRAAILMRDDVHPGVFDLVEAYYGKEARDAAEAVSRRYVEELARAVKP